MSEAESGLAPGETTSIALALVNTRIDGPRGTVESLEKANDLGDWLRQVVAAETGDPSAAELRMAIELRAAVRSLFTHPTDEHKRALIARVIVNRAAAADPGAPQLSSAGIAAAVGWAGSGSNSASTALAGVARDAIAVLSAGTPLRECAAPDCNRMFIPDHGRRIWCSATCGSRVRGLRHYARRSSFVG